MISVENLEVEFGTVPLFQGVSYVVNDKDRIALVGKNGAGKSTMLKLAVADIGYCVCIAGYNNRLFTAGNGIV